MFKVKGEGLAGVQATEKGFIRQFIINGPDGNKDVIKVFSKDAEKLKGQGVQDLNIRQDFFLLFDHGVFSCQTWN